ncbi:MAG: hypothetical protein Q7U34_08455 [Anaerolineales bacterium]|nr:hypothetical protein [Anaerolineales bacterium]
MKKKLVIIAIVLLFIVVACESGPLFDPGTPTPIPLTETPTPTPLPTVLRVAYIRDGNVWLWTKGAGSRPLNYDFTNSAIP